MKEQFNKAFAIYNRQIDITNPDEVQGQLYELLLLQDTAANLYSLSNMAFVNKKAEFYKQVSISTKKQDQLKAEIDAFTIDELTMRTRAEHFQKDIHYAIEGFRSILSNLKQEKANIIKN